MLVERTVAGLHGALMRYLPLTLSHDCPILDIGCGTGAWLERLADSGFTDLWGVDRDATHFGCERARFLKADLDADRLEIGDTRFGLITAIEVIEHLENPGRLFSIVATFLDRHGYLLMTTPNIHSLLCRFRFCVTGHLKQFDSKGDPTHIYPVLLESLKRVLPRYELEIASQWWYPDDGSSITSRRSLKLVTAVLRILLPDDVPGDLLCLLIRRRVDQELRGR